MQGCSGQQLLQLTDKGLLQLGVQDAAERQALLTARTKRQEQQGQQQQPLKQQQQPPVGLDDVKLAMPSAAVAVGAGLGSPGAAAAVDSSTDGLQDTGGSADDAKKAGVRWVCWCRGPTCPVCLHGHELC